MDSMYDEDGTRVDAKYNVIVAKLEKLDKLDELLRKLDTMKVLTWFLIWPNHF